MHMDFEFEPPEVIFLNVQDTERKFPVRRIYCVGRNYAAHVREMNKGMDSRDPPFFFQKPRDAIVHANSKTAMPAQIQNSQDDAIDYDAVEVPYPPLTNNLHYEVEMVVAIGKGGANISSDVALDHVFGYAVGIDMTRRDLQTICKEKSWPWETAKAFDHSAPIGTLVKVSTARHDSGRAISLTVNEQMKQSSNTKEMIWSVAEVVSELSKQYILEQGDIVMTGTPDGVGAVVRGDMLEAKIIGLPALLVHIV